MSLSRIKIKTLYVMRILMEETDEEHCLTAKGISEKLKYYGLDSDRRSIYNDIEVLTEFGLDIVKAPGNKGWFLGKREFELVELELLIDAVRVAKFIPSQKTETLVKKIKSMTNKYSAQAMNREIVFNALKVDNKIIYYSIDAVHKAIAENSKISFQYMEWTETKEIRLRKNGKVYEVSPWGILWSNEQYYLLAYERQNDEIRHYRIDRMCNVGMLMECREGDAEYKKYISSFTSKTFGMYGGNDVWVELRCENHMAGVIIDRFGKELSFMKDDENHFRVKVLITVSPQFWGWITAMGGNIEIVAPEQIKNDYIQYITCILDSANRR